ncbi:MAG: insulinase family protein [Steroidobacteraceae bacterium]|nr:insulinase family protein [Steroidobacteraceae bacterium]MBP9130768.1 insulinase family protein [Steroidobacteraceae bacterium]
MRRILGAGRDFRGASPAAKAWRATAIAFGLTFGAFTQAAAPEVPGASQIVTRTLPNGMKLVVWPDKDIPNVAMYTWYRVGSRNERPGITGISHFFEHMMFNGTKTRAPGEFDRIMEGSGGSNNAYTSSDVTVYQNWFPSSVTSLIFDLESDRMRNLDFDAEKVESERGVVFSERRSSVDNDNFGTLIEQMQATAFVAHPYQIPVIGWPSDIEGWKVTDLQDYYHQYYAPNNAVMFIVGDVDPEAVFKLADQYLASIPAQPAPPAVTTKEPPQLGECRLRIGRDAQTPLIAMAWHTAAESAREARVMEVLLAILGDGDSSRLYQRLVEHEQAAVDVGTQFDAGFDPGLAWVYAVVPPGGDVTRTEKLIDEEIARLAQEGPTPVEITKARNQALVGFWRGLETISGKAQALGQYEVFHGDYRKLFGAPAEYESITAEDVKNAATTVLRRENRTVGVLEPKVEPSVTPQAPATAGAT